MAFCSKCGNSLEDGVKFCANCGQPVEMQPAQPAYAAPAQPVYAAPAQPVANANKAEADAKIDGVFGKAIAAVICAWIPIASIVAIVLGSKALTAWSEASAMAQAGGFQLTGKSIPTRILSMIGKIGGIVMTVFYGIYFLILIIAAIAAM